MDFQTNPAATEQTAFVPADPGAARLRWWWFWGLLLGGPILVLVVAYGVLSYTYYSQSVRITKNYVAELNAPTLAVPEEQRAWTHYRRALLLLEREPEKGVTVYTPGEVNWELTVEYLRRNKRALAAIRNAASIRPLGLILQDAPHREDIEWRLHHGAMTSAEAAIVGEPSDNPEVTMVISPDPVFRLLSLSRLLEADCRLAVLESDHDRVIANMIALFDIADQVAEHSFLLDELVAFVLRENALRLTGSVLAMREIPLTDVQLAVLADRFQGEFKQGTLRLRLNDEQVYFKDWLQRYFTDDGDGDGWMSPGGLAVFGRSDLYGEAERPPGVRWLPAPLAARQVATRRESREKLKECADELLRLAGIPLWQRSPTSGFFEDDADLRQPRFWLIADMFDNTGTFLAAAEKRTQQRDALMVAVALVRHHRRHSAWPKALSELSLEFLKSVPPDRFDGQPLRYRLIDGRPKLYSIGTDLDDDGGTPGGDPDNPETVAAWPPDPSIDGDWVLWPPPEKAPAVTMILTPPTDDPDSAAADSFDPPRPPEPSFDDIEPSESQIEPPADDTRAVEPTLGD